jgi:hypothetical protein
MAEPEGSTAGTCHRRQGTVSVYKTLYAMLAGYYKSYGLKHLEKDC